MAMTLSYIQTRLVELASYFIDESQKKRCFFEQYMDSDLTILREHEKDFGNIKYSQFLELQHWLTCFAIKFAFNLDDFNRGPAASAELSAALDEMNDAIVACKKHSPLVSCSLVDNKEAHEIITEFFSTNNSLLVYDGKKSKKLSLSFKVRSNVLDNMYLFINLGRIGSYKVEIGMFNPKFTIDVGVVMSSRSYSSFSTVEDLHKCLDNTEKMFIEFLPYLERVLQENVEI